VTLHRPPQHWVGIHDAIGRDIAGLGGYLRCETCRRVVEFYPSARADYLRRGWPKCCGDTMRWWTQRQIDAGEVPALTS
jgi:hypothetical protein